MQNILASIALTALQTLIKESPALVARIRAALNKPDVTEADIETLKAEIAADTYEKLVPNSKLPSAAADGTRIA